MNISINEKIIEYQNSSEKRFQEKKNVKTITNYIFAIVLFFLSTIVAAFTFPLRFIYKKIIPINCNSQIIDLTDDNIDSVTRSAL